MMRRSCLLLAVACLGCPSDDGNDSDDSAVSAPASMSQGTGDSDGTSTGTDSLTTGVSASASAGTTDDTTGMPMTSEESTASPEGSGSSGDPNACNPVVPGEWNSCHDDMGGVDTTLCNWVGDPDATGFIGCLVSSKMPEYNTCFISGCEDACDCFAPPATGTAVVECADILADGGTGCHLNCSDGATCPDGMECQGTSCFWPPA